VEHWNLRILEEFLLFALTPNFVFHQYAGPQGMQTVRGMMHGYPPQMQQHFQTSNGQYPGYSPQQIPGGMTQQRLPGMPYGIPPQGPGRFTVPSNIPQSQQQQQQQQQQRSPYAPPLQQRQDSFQGNQNVGMAPPKQENKSMASMEQHQSLASTLNRPALVPQPIGNSSQNDHYGQGPPRNQSTAPSPSSLGEASSLHHQKSMETSASVARPQVVSPVSPMFQPNQQQRMSQPSHGKYFACGEVGGGKADDRHSSSLLGLID
jgi:hypothetical protein